MHLMGHALNNINTRKSKVQITDGKRRQLEQDWHAHNRVLRQTHQPRISFEQYVTELYGTAPHKTPRQTAQARKQAPEYVRPVTYRRDQGVVYKSADDGIGVAPAPQRKEYTGTLVRGISQTHKSNAVPVISQEEIVDIRHMRR
jgi:hypothetical protein